MAGKRSDSDEGDGVEGSETPASDAGQSAPVGSAGTPPPHAALPSVHASAQKSTAPPSSPVAPKAGTVARQMLEALVCPLSGTRLDYDAGNDELISKTAGLAFPIRSGIPIMLVDEARKLGD